jgi:hypothetical protein
MDGAGAVGDGLGEIVGEDAQPLKLGEGLAISFRSSCMETPRSGIPAPPLFLNASLKKLVRAVSDTTASQRACCLGLLR